MYQLCDNIYNLLIFINFVILYCWKKKFKNAIICDKRCIHVPDNPVIFAVNLEETGSCIGLLPRTNPCLEVVFCCEISV